MGGCGCGSGALENQVTDPALRLFLTAHSSAVRDFVGARRALGRAWRADRLLGEGAGTGDRLRAHAYAEASAELFRQAQHALRDAVGALDADRRGQIDAVLADSGLRRIGASARTRAVLTLVEEDCSAAEAADALERLDAGLRTVEEITSTTAAADYLDERFSRLSDTSVALQERTDSVREFCILILLIFSLYITEIVLLVLACPFIPGCNIADELEKWLRQMCPALGPSGSVG
jgi:hypothetical protein